ncbi:MAG TPA: hypothetical protein VGC41_15300 [Kofleriaceae bacterium]
MAESIFNDAWDGFAAKGEEGSWSVDIDMPPSFVSASANLNMYQQHSANAYAYAGVHSYVANNEEVKSTGFNGVVGAITQPNTSRVTFAHAIGCDEGECVLASFVLQAFIWD